MAGSGPDLGGEAWLPGVIELLDVQRGLFRELEGLSEQQSKWVSTGETERLLGVLAAKQRVVERVQGVNASLQPYMSDWAARVAGLSERSRVLLRSRTDELEALASRVKSRDEADRAALEASSKVVAEDLAGMARARGAAAAYGGGRSALYQDRRG